MFSLFHSCISELHINEAQGKDSEEEGKWKETLLLRNYYKHYNLRLLFRFSSAIRKLLFAGAVLIEKGRKRGTPKI